MGVTVANTQEGECVATVKASEIGLYGRVVERALGISPSEPTHIVTDNLPNKRVAQNVDSAQRSRYFLIRYACLHVRIQEGEFECIFTHDPNNPSDYLTKFGLTQEKLETSIAYACGRRTVSG